MATEKDIKKLHRRVSEHVNSIIDLLHKIEGHRSDARDEVVKLMDEVTYFRKRNGY